MSLGQIGRQFVWRVMMEEIPFLIVDPMCPTIRNRGAAWISATAEALYFVLGYSLAEKVLLTPTNPVYVVTVFKTYPIFDASYYKMTKEEFNKFRRDFCNQVQDNRPFWLKEGF
jgi:hypothetical protein